MILEKIIALQNLKEINKRVIESYKNNKQCSLTIRYMYEKYWFNLLDY